LKNNDFKNLHTISSGSSFGSLGGGIKLQQGGPGLGLKGEFIILLVSVLFFSSILLSSNNSIESDNLVEGIWLRIFPVDDILVNG